MVDARRAEFHLGPAHYSTPILRRAMKTPAAITDGARLSRRCNVVLKSRRFKGLGTLTARLRPVAWASGNPRQTSKVS